MAGVARLRYTLEHMQDQNETGPGALISSSFFVSMSITLQVFYWNLSELGHTAKLGNKVLIRIKTIS